MSLRKISVLVLSLLFVAGFVAQPVLASHTKSCPMKHGASCCKSMKKCPMKMHSWRTVQMDRTAGSVPVYGACKSQTGTAMKKCDMRKKYGWRSTTMERTAGSVPVYSKKDCDKGMKKKCPMKR